jgi:hypothetical protein
VSALITPEQPGVDGTSLIDHPAPCVRVRPPGRDTLGRPLAPLLPLRCRLAAQLVLHENGCWMWTGATVATHYGGIHVDGKNRTVHRVVYELLIGPVPAGLEIDHLCRVTRCANPEHLEPVTGAENMRRMLAFHDTGYCPHGHQFGVAGNDYRRPDGTRECRPCNRRESAERRQRQAAAEGRVLGVREVRTHCGNGHAYTPQNTMIDAEGKRRCRACANARAAAYRARKNAEASA